MAINKKRYLVLPINETRLRDSLDPSVLVTYAPSLQYVDVEYDDSIIDESAVDSEMAKQNGMPDPHGTSLADPPATGLIDSSGVLWGEKIDPITGIISTEKVK